jgi:hypothetical protein
LWAFEGQACLVFWLTPDQLFRPKKARPCAANWLKGSLALRSSPESASTWQWVFADQMGVLCHALIQGNFFSRFSGSPANSDPRGS